MLGAMGTMYWRGKILEESLCYEHKEHGGSLPRLREHSPKGHGEEIAAEFTLIRSAEGRGQPAHLKLSEKYNLSRKNVHDGW